jgi:hypothetical protein
MTHMIVQIPARITRAPRAAEPLANAALAVSRVMRRAGFALLKALRSRHLLAQGTGHAAKPEAACANGMGGIKG